MKAQLASVLLLWGACTVERTLLDNPHGIITSCRDAWEQGTPGAPCALDAPCARPSPDESACCTDTASCPAGALWLERACRPECACRDDAQCAFGRTICVDLRCQACPPTDVCAPCPPRWVRLTRNGCATCQCGPPSQCDHPMEPCMDGGSAGRPGICYPGESCAAGCDPWQPGCCSNACSQEGCAMPAPLGCLTECPPDVACGACAADSCECDGARWMCAPICADDLSFTCAHPSREPQP
jgi:hypothetical protein